MGKRPTDDWVSIAKAAIRQDPTSFEMVMGAGEAERRNIFAPLTAGERNLPRALLRKEQQWTEMPKQSRPFFP